MAFDYIKTRNTANSLVKKFGQAVTITHVIQGSYDPATGGMTNTSSTQYGTGAMTEWDSRQVDGALVRIGDRRLLLSPLNTAGVALTAPVLEDTVTDAAGVVYTLVAPLNILSPAGTIVLFDCNLRT